MTINANIVDRSLIGVDYRAVHIVYDISTSLHIAAASWKFKLNDPCLDPTLVSLTTEPTAYNEYQYNSATTDINLMKSFTV